MPKRSNDFQKLLVTIQRIFAPTGAVVEESAMVTAPGIGQLREIDVLVSNSKSGPYKLKIAFEAKDHKRQLNVTDIEGIIGKYRSQGSLVVDKVYVVTRRGISKTAKQKAEMNGIGVLTLLEIESTGIPGYAARQSRVEVAQRPHPTQPVLFYSNGTKISGKALTTGAFVCKCHGHNKGDIRKVLNWAFSKLPKEARAAVDNQVKASGKACVQCTINLSQSNLRFTDSIGVHDLFSLSFHVHASKVSAPMEVSTYELSGDSIDTCKMQVATAEIAGTRVEFSKPVGRPGKMIFRVNPCSQK